MPAEGCLAWQKLEWRPWSPPYCSASGRGANRRGTASPFIAVGGARGRDRRCYWRPLGARKLNAPQRQPRLPLTPPVLWAPRPCHGRALSGKFRPAAAARALVSPQEQWVPGRGMGREEAGGLRVPSPSSPAPVFRLCRGAGSGHLLRVRPCAGCRDARTSRGEHPTALFWRGCFELAWPSGGLRGQEAGGGLLVPLGRHLGTWAESPS